MIRLQIMPFAAGTRLGPYEVLGPIGAGGMGEVYRARDTRLARDVALKTLPDNFLHDLERVARLKREAQVLAALNHPGIASIYGVEESNGHLLLVLELVEGETLAEMIARGPVPLDEALRICHEIATALEAAHDKGVVHRDLKPANIKVRQDGAVKVLDFGLAKAIAEPAGTLSPNVAQSPTFSFQPTQAGIILGTAAYMSPEQAAGKGVDRRSDLWAFGVVLMEMLTGRPVFPGDSVPHVLAAVLKSDPDWTALPNGTPAAIRRLLRRCLDKDRRRRLESAADARLEIEDALVPAVEPSGAPERAFSRVIPLVGVAIAAAVLTALGTWAMLRQRAPQERPLTARFTIVPERPLRISPFESTLAVSPDGQQIVYSSRDLDSSAAISGTAGTLMLRPMNQLDSRRLAPYGRSPFFSPDGEWVGFFDDNDFFLKKVSVSGGAPVRICPFNGGPRGASWGGDNTIVFATAHTATGLWRVSANGGAATVLTTPQAAKHEGDHVFPSVLPHGRGVLFTIIEAGRPDSADVAVLDPATGEHRILVRGGTHPRYVSPGYLLYAATGTLQAARFDLGTLQVNGDATPVIQDLLMTGNGAAYYAVSNEGTLAFIAGPAASQPPRALVWVDRQGREEPIPAPTRPYTIARLSPDGTRVALDARDQENDIWIWDFARRTLRKLTDGPGLDQYPIWSPGGSRVIYTSDRAGRSNLYVQSADGTGPVERLTEEDTTQWATAIAPDGRIVGTEFGSVTSFDLFAVPFASRAARPDGSTPVVARTESLLREPLAQSNADVSPNGRYIVYQSNESGRFEVYVRPFPNLRGGKWQISTDGGTRPVWGRNGRELFFADGSQAVMAVPVETSGPFSWGNAAKLFGGVPFTVGVVFRGFDVSENGRRFLMLKEQSEASAKTPPPRIVVALNWIEELRARVPQR